MVDFSRCKHLLCARGLNKSELLFKEEFEPLWISNMQLKHHACKLEKIYQTFQNCQITIWIYYLRFVKVHLAYMIQSQINAIFSSKTFVVYNLVCIGRYSYSHLFIESLNTFRITLRLLYEIQKTKKINILNLKSSAYGPKHITKFWKLS